MGFGGGGAKPMPAPIPLPPASAHPAVLGSNLTALSSNSQAQKSAAAAGYAGLDKTIATSPQGLKDKANTANVTLLGQ